MFIIIYGWLCHAQRYRRKNKADLFESHYIVSKTLSANDGNKKLLLHHSAGITQFIIWIFFQATLLSLTSLFLVF